MILGVGRLGPEKRFDFFLQILSRCRQEARVPLRACLVGDGPLRPELEEMSRSLGLLDVALQFRGKLDDVRPLYAEADLLMLTSEREGTPNVIMEAMACGLPVVATAVGDVPELVRHQVSGFVLGVGDVPGFLAAVKDLADNPLLRESMGAQGRCAIEARHDLALLPGTLANLYADTLS